MTDWRTPEPRPDVVALLARALVFRHDDPEAAVLVDERRAWTTAVEREQGYSLALDVLGGRRAMLTAQADQLGAAVRDDDGQGV